MPGSRRMGAGLGDGSSAVRRQMRARRQHASGEERCSGQLQPSRGHPVWIVGADPGANPGGRRTRRHSGRHALHAHANQASAKKLKVFSCSGPTSPGREAGRSGCRPRTSPELSRSRSGGGRRSRRRSRRPPRSAGRCGPGRRLCSGEGSGEVRVHEVEAGALAVDHDVVAGVALVARVLDRAAAGGDQRRAAGGHHVLALVGVARPGGSEASAGVAEVVGAEEREGVPEEGEAEAERRSRLALARRAPAPRSGRRSGTCSGRCAPAARRRRSRPSGCCSSCSARRRCGRSSARSSPVESTTSMRRSFCGWLLPIA